MQNPVASARSFVLASFGLQDESTNTVDSFLSSGRIQVAFSQ